MSLISINNSYLLNKLTNTNANRETSLEMSFSSKHFQSTPIRKIFHKHVSFECPIRTSNDRQNHPKVLFHKPDNYQRNFEQSSEVEVLSKVDEFCDSMKDYVKSVLIDKEQYRTLAVQIDDAYMEVKDPHSVFTPPNDPISRFNYIINIFQQPVVKELMVKCSEKEEIIQNLQGERGNLLKCTDSLSVIFTSFVSWVIETSNNLKQKIQCYEIDEEDEMELIDPFDKEAIETIVTEYLEIFMNRENGNVSDIDNTLFHRYLLKVKQLIESLANANPNQFDDSSNSQNGSHINLSLKENNQQIKFLQQQNEDLKKQLINAQQIISTKILPEFVIKALNETKELTLKEISEIDEKFSSERLSIEKHYEEKLDEYRQQLEKQDEEMQKTENEFSALKRDLKFVEKKYEDFEKYHNEILRDFEGNIEKCVMENIKLKKNLKIKECCDHCVLKNSVQISHKCVGISWQCIDSETASQIDVNITDTCQEKVVEDCLAEIADLKNYVQVLQEVITNQQNTIDSCNATARLQSQIIAKRQQSPVSSILEKSNYFSTKSNFLQDNSVLCKTTDLAQSIEENISPADNNFNSFKLLRNPNCSKLSTSQTHYNAAQNHCHLKNELQNELQNSRISFHDECENMEFYTSTPFTSKTSSKNKEKDFQPTKIQFLRINF